MHICICLWDIAKFVRNLPAIRYDRILYKNVGDWSVTIVTTTCVGITFVDEWAVVGFKMFQVKWCNVSFLLAEVFSECRMIAGDFQI